MDIWLKVEYGMKLRSIAPIGGIALQVTTINAL